MGVRNSAHALGYFYLKEKNLKSADDSHRIKPSKTVRSGIEHVSFNKKRGITHVVFSDGTKMKVTCQKGDKWDKRQGVLNCIAKKFFGVGGAYDSIVDNLVEEGEDYE